MFRMHTGGQMPPGPSGNWLLGTAGEFSRDPLAYMQRYQKDYGPAWTVMARVRKIVVISDPEWVKYVLQDNNKNYVKSFGYELLKPLLGNGLLTSEGAFWMSQRRLMQPAFHKQAIQRFASIFQEEGEHTVERLKVFADRGEAVNFSAEMSRLTMTIVSRCLLGSVVPGDIERIGVCLEVLNRDANHRIQKPINWPMAIPTPHNRKVNRALEELNRTIHALISGKRNSGERGEDLLSLLLETQDADTGERMNDRQLRDEIATIFIAGHETTANALCWTLYLLATHPDVENRLMQEIERAEGEGLDLAAVPYVRQVVRESLRLYPPAWIVGRIPLEEDRIAGHRVPAGTNVLMPILSIQRDPAFWPDPERFDPDRHADEEAQRALPKYAYFPFGGGPRICIGLNFALMELHLLLPVLLKSLRYRYAATHPPKMEHLITLHPAGGMMLYPERRKAT